MTIKNQKLFLLGRKDAIATVKPVCKDSDYIAGYENGIAHLGAKVEKEKELCKHAKGKSNEQYNPNI